MKTAHAIRVAGLLVLLGWAAVPLTAAEPLTAEQAVARCAEALGGADKIAAVKTLRITVDYPDRTIPCEADIAFLFPAFFDYPAEYAGLETVDGREHHKVAVVLPLGIRMTYYLDAATFLPARIVAGIPDNGVVYRCEHAVGDYEKADGLLFPRTSDADSWGPPGRAKITSVELNVPLGDERFQMP